MLYPFAITPDVFRPTLLEKSPSALISVKLLLHGLCENGLIADLHNEQWSKYIVNDLLPKLPPQPKADLQKYLSVLMDRHRLVVCPPYRDGNPVCEEDWLHAAIDVHARTPLRGIVLSKRLLTLFGLPHETFIELTEILDEPRWAERPRTPEVETSLAGYEMALTSALQYAKTLDLIDPNFCCEKRFLEMVRLCARLLGKQRIHQSTRRISIHAGKPKDDVLPADRLNEWERNLRPLVDANPALRFRVFLWERSSTSWQKLHDRYLLTDQCGIKVGYGLDICPGNRTTLSLLDEETRRAQLSKYQESSTDFTLLASCEVRK